VPVVHMKSLLEAGVHFGHRTRRWNPKMKPYIFTERNGIHIIDLQQTMSSIERSYNLVRDFVAQGGSVLLTGTKKQAQDTIAFEAERCGMPYVNQRWLGGTLTNFRTMRQRIEKLSDMEGQRERGEFGRLTKKEALEAEGEISKLIRRFGGMRDMRRLPDVLYVTDVRREALAVKEANILNIPVIALVDTNCDPDPVNYVIPANDDAIRAIKLITSKIADAVIEGKEIRAVTVGAQEQEEEEREDERYLGPATLAKLRLGGDEGDDEAGNDEGPWESEADDEIWEVPEADEEK
jgi:small subunit ribosomal protein S2